MKGKKIIRFILLLIISVVVLICIQQLLVPKYMSKTLEGALIAEYYAEDYKEHDVMFIGDCEVYENFSPITLWEEYGITSYIRGSAQQLIWQSYYLLEDTLRYEKPDIVVFNVLSMKYGQPQKEEYNRLNLDGMRWSLSKLNAVNASMTEEEDLLSYLFPLLRYHSRWNKLTLEDVKYMFTRDLRSNNGYLMQAGVKPVTYIQPGKKLANYQFDDICYEYLDKMAALCKENGITLILIKAPSLYPDWYEEWEEQIVAYAKEKDIQYINFLDVKEEAGIDYTTDTYDAGLHLNVYGAEKLSLYFGQILQEQFALTDHRIEDHYEEIWSKKVATYYTQRERLIEEASKVE